MSSNQRALEPAREAREFRIEELLGRLNEVEERNKPETLFTIGDTGLLQGHPRTAIVGARNASELGLARARKLARLLAGRGVVVVSGLAEGIDTAAHWAAIRAGGRTIGVLGSPLDVVFRQADGSLRAIMEKEHLVVSQFPTGHPVLRSNFPRRNRTMALLTHATVIIEASDSSGSLSQGWEALRLGRQLFILKSLADDPRLEWPAEMVKYGASVLSESGVEALFDALPPTEEPGWLERLAF